MTVKQISAFLENKPGALAAFTKILQNYEIDLRALSLAETEDFGTFSVSRASAFSRRALRNDHQSPATGTRSERTRNIGFANLTCPSSLPHARE